jgi:hypothetical protein
MHYQGPSSADLANVRALNSAFLALHCDGHRSERLRDDGLPELSELLRALNERQAQRLADAPFLLFTLREQDEALWSSILQDDDATNLELFSPPRSQVEQGLLAAALGFLWRLAAQNPYGARLVSGAPVAWCERLAGCTLLQLLQRATHRADLLRPRFGDNRTIWSKLLGDGVSTRLDVRQAAQLTALQCLLTRPAPDVDPGLRAAACRMPRPPAR